MSHNPKMPEHQAELSPKQRYELERWARLNGMTLDQFLKTAEATQHRVLQARRGVDTPRSNPA